MENVSGFSIPRGEILFCGAICEILKNRQPGGSEALDKRLGGG